ncbi:MAG: hydrogenase nickel incorporation protein HypB [Actinobacteria bacterium]|nr:hydrogenase nickel incorporation protein HypB [Actinomycetota bacterium]
MEIEIVNDVLEYNKEHAQVNRQLFKDNNILVINILSSPGAGKTSLITQSIQNLPDFRIGVIEGDVSSTYDAEKIKKYTDDVVQINTGGTCHLNASMIEKALKKINVKNLNIIFIENVGNLICPVGFDLGEDYKVLLSSVSEGDDKPVKYPKGFIKSSAIVLNKIDLLQNSDFNYDFFEKKVREINTESPIIKLSCKTGEGISSWIKWITSKKENKKNN